MSNLVDQHGQPISSESTNPFDFMQMQGANIDVIDPEMLNNLQFILKDVLAGDSDAAARPEFAGIDLPLVKTTLDYILSKDGMSAAEKAQLVNESWRINFRDRPPTPEEFLTDKYIGPVANTVFPHVKKAFLEFMDPTKPYRTAVLAPFIGYGKSFLSVLINLYVGTNLSMMKHVYKFFSHSPATVYTQVLGSCSLKKSSELLLEPFMNVLDSSDFFEKVQTKDGMAKRDKDFSRMGNIDRIFWTTASPTSALQLSNGANFKLVSTPNALLGQSIVTGTLSELSFFSDAGFSDEYIFKFFTKLRGRIESRMKGHYLSRFILDSSPNTLESVIDDWVVNIAPKNPQNYIVNGARWKHVKTDFPEDTFDQYGEVRPEKGFPVFLGGNGRPPAVLTHQEALTYGPTEIIYVPDTIAMRGTFEENVYEALKDQAGIPSGSADRIFYDGAKIEEIFEPSLRNVYTHILADSKLPPEGLIWESIKDQFFIKILDRYRFWYKPNLPRVFAVDQSISGDVTSISIAHVERELLPPELQTVDTKYKTIYVVDLTVVIAPGGGRINLDAIRYFLIDLVQKGNMSLVHGSFDQFQSESTMQHLIRQKMPVERLSVDRTLDPYLNFISIVESGRLKCGQNLHFKNNLKSLQFQQRRGANGTKSTGTKKVDHTKGELVIDSEVVSWERSTIGINAKDVADSVCACCELLRKHNVLAYDEWEPTSIKTLTREESREKMLELLNAQGLTV